MTFRTPQNGVSPSGSASGGDGNHRDVARGSDRAGTLTTELALALLVDAGILTAAAAQEIREGLAGTPRDQGNWATGTYADVVEVISEGGVPDQLLIDGRPFPWILAEKPFEIWNDAAEVPSVTVTIFAREVRETERSPLAESGFEVSDSALKVSGRADDVSEDASGGGDVVVSTFFVDLYARIEQSLGDWHIRGHIDVAERGGKVAGNRAPHQKILPFVARVGARYVGPFSSSVRWLQRRAGLRHPGLDPSVVGVSEATEAGDR